MTSQFNEHTIRYSKLILIFQAIEIFLCLIERQNDSKNFDTNFMTVC